MVGGGLDRHRVSALGEEPHRQRDPLARPAGEHQRIGAHDHSEAAEAVGQDLSEPGEALWAAVGQKRSADVGEGPVDGPPEGLHWKHRGIRHQGVEGNGVAGYAELGTGVLVIEKPLGRR